MAKRKKPVGRRSEDEANDRPAPAPKVATSLGALLKDAKRTPKAVKDAKGNSKLAAPAAPRRARSEAPPPLLPAPGPAPLHPVPTLAPPRPGGGKGDATAARAALESASALSAAEQAALARAFAGARPIARPARGRKHAPAPASASGGGVDPKLDRAARERLGALVAGGVRFEVQRDAHEVTGLAAGCDARLLARLGGSGLTPEGTCDLHGLHSGEVGAAVERFLRASKRAGRRYVLLIHGKGLHSAGGVGVLGDAVLEALTSGGSAPIVAAFATPNVRHGGNGALAVALR